jgi:hypothetical protein
MRMPTGCNCEANAIGHAGLPLNVTQAAEIPGSSQRPNGNSRLLTFAHPTLNGSGLQYFDSAMDRKSAHNARIGTPLLQISLNLKPGVKCSCG